MTRNFFIYAVQFILQRLSRVLAFHGEYVFQGFFFRAQDLNLFLMRVEVLVKNTASIHQVVQLTFEVGRIVTTTTLTGVIVCLT